MKNIYYLAFFLPAFAFSQENVKISADLRGRDCNGGGGICSVATRSLSGKSTDVLVEKTGEHSIVFIISKSNLSSDAQKSVAGSEFSKISLNEIPKFHQEKDLLLEENLLQKLAINPKFAAIKEGYYPMQIDDKNVTIHFTLVEL